MPSTKRISKPKPLKWNDGPPPSIGWWPASMTRDPTALRWWDGKSWGPVCYAWMTAQIAADRTASPAKDYPVVNAPILWRNRPRDWPARSRT